MWMPNAPDSSAALRQGDLLTGLMLPRLAWPLSYARPPEAAVAGNQTVLLSATRPSAYLVVSQCCTIENQTVAALAVVRSTRSLSAAELREYELEEPSGDPDLNYVFNLHALMPFQGHLLRQDGRIYVADLTSTQSYSGAISDFQKARVAAMSPAGRRLLRIRLALFWGRVEREDEQWFEENGLPAGQSAPIAEDAAAMTADGSPAEEVT
jgi:hypothetical protein